MSPHELSTYVSELPTVDDWISGDDRTLAFTVTDDDGNGIDISTASVNWELYEYEYNDDTSNATLSGSDSGVELVTDSRVDSANGDWEVRLDGSATDDLWGEYYQRPRVVQSDGSQATWLGTVVITG